ncbi:MAG: hypothetical protein M3332_14175 [Actinomycetota bacterium]|nr:hypothetical protein [Actinomycetota bacterium]
MDHPNLDGLQRRRRSGLYIFATVWLIQRGAPESKTADRIGRGSEGKSKVPLPAQIPRHGPRWWLAHAVFSRSLELTMAGLFLLFWLAQSIAGRSAYNADQLSEQSEFLAIGLMAMLGVYLRQRGSPESKPVEPHHKVTADSG